MTTLAISPSVLREGLLALAYARQKDGAHDEAAKLRSLATTTLEHPADVFAIVEQLVGVERAARFKKEIVES